MNNAQTVKAMWHALFKGPIAPAYFDKALAIVGLVYDATPRATEAELEQATAIMNGTADSLFDGSHHLGAFKLAEPTPEALSQAIKRGFEKGLKRAPKRSASAYAAKPEGSMSERIVSALTAAGRPLSAASIQDKTGISRASIGAMMSQLTKRGKVKRSGEWGSYRYTAK